MWLVTYFLALTLSGASAPVWQLQNSGSTAELRGVAVFDGRRAWASGAGGTVLATREGERWEKRTVPGGGELDFRDVETLDASTVILMSAGTGSASRIYRSADGGEAWTLLHTRKGGVEAVGPKGTILRYAGGVADARLMGSDLLRGSDPTAESPGGCRRRPRGRRR
ncbi:MAG: hypothetical protein WEB59_05125 [Thermoanaerobaculia bacterium]